METARWLLLLTRLPSDAAQRERVGIWRKLKRSGALVLRDSVYLFPAKDEALEIANWLAGEIRATDGEAQVARVTSIDGYPDTELVRRFHELRDADYLELEPDLKEAIREGQKGGDEARKSLRTLLRRSEQRLEEIARTDFFESPAGGRVRALVAQGRALLEPAQRPDGELSTEDYRGRLWVTRTRPKIDRLASAWLIRRFIDPEARFGFIEAEGKKVPSGALTFDTFGGDFTHEGDECTFEVLARRFGVNDPGVRVLAEIVHDCDLEDGKFQRSEPPVVLALVRGLVATISDDDELVRAALPVFEALRAAYATPEAPHAAKKPRRAKSRRSGAS
jgi:hypothetical protein